MEKLSLLVTLSLATLMGAFIPVNANPQGDVLETAERYYIIDPKTGDKIDPETGAVIEESEEVVGEEATEVMEEDVMIVEPGVDAASETGEEAPAE